MLSQPGISSRCDVVIVRHSFWGSNDEGGRVSLTSLFYNKKKSISQPLINHIFELRLEFYRRDRTLSDTLEYHIITQDGHMK
jgi:hypothetical protein